MLKILFLSTSVGSLGSGGGGGVELTVQNLAQGACPSGSSARGGSTTKFLAE